MTVLIPGGEIIVELSPVTTDIVVDVLPVTQGVVVEVVPDNGLISNARVRELIDLFPGATNGAMLVKSGNRLAYSMTPPAHEHTVGQIAGLQDALNTASSLTPPIVASANLSALRVVLIQSGELAYASASNTAHAFRVLGILPTAVNAGASARVLTDGPITDSSWNWQVDRPVWLGSNGNLTQTPPVAGFLLQVGTAVTPTQLDFEIQEAVLL